MIRHNTLNVISLSENSVILSNTVCESNLSKGLYVKVFNFIIKKISSALLYVYYF
nr:hypothetical protein CoNPh37_CDS0191 [Staphylococcus phage S-CoN_Ph37]